MNISLDELNQMKYSDLLCILILNNPDNEVVRQATQEDFDNF